LKDIRRALEKKPLTDKDLSAYEATRHLAADILQAVQEMKAGHVITPGTEYWRKGSAIYENKI
jgi:putative transcriptional regulator